MPEAEQSTEDAQLELGLSHGTLPRIIQNNSYRLLLIAEQLTLLQLELTRIEQELDNNVQSMLRDECGTEEMQQRGERNAELRKEHERLLSEIELLQKQLDYVDDVCMQVKELFFQETP